MGCLMCIIVGVLVVVQYEAIWSPYVAKDMALRLSPMGMQYIT